VADDLRPAVPGELCTCGRPAVTVIVGSDLGPVGHCGLNDGGAPVDGVCTFCGDTIDHRHYWSAEFRAGRPAASSGGAPQGGRCPLYRLRLADPLPEVHADSVVPFDRDTDRQTQSEYRLQLELAHLFGDLGVDFTAKTYSLDQLDDEAEPEAGTIEDVIFDICWMTRQALGADPGDITSRDPDAGQTAVAALVTMLRPRLDDAGMSPNPLDGVDARGLVDAAGGDDAWSDTVAFDRPLLIVRRVVRRAITPEAPNDIYRQWWS
jgi:hypothetical protein